MSDDLNVSLSVLVNMVIAYMIFSVSLGGFSWPADHCDVFWVAFYWILNIGLAFLNTRIGRR